MANFGISSIKLPNIKGVNVSIPQVNVPSVESILKQVTIDDKVAKAKSMFKDAYKSNEYVKEIKSDISEYQDMLPDSINNYLKDADIDFSTMFDGKIADLKFEVDPDKALNYIKANVAERVAGAKDMAIEKIKSVFSMDNLIDVAKSKFDEKRDMFDEIRNTTVQSVIDDKLSEKLSGFSSLGQYGDIASVAKVFKGDIPDVVSEGDYGPAIDDLMSGKTGDFDFDFDSYGFDTSDLNKVTEDLNVQANELGLDMHFSFDDIF